MHARENKNHTVTKFAAFVHVVCDTICTHYWQSCSKKAKKIPMDPSSWTRAWPPSVLIL